MLDWNDLRHFLALSRAGSLAGAARILGVEHSTVGRRLASLESALGTKLFTRTSEGLLLTEVGRDILAHVERMEQGALAVERRASGEDKRLEGIVRLTTSEGFTGFLVKRFTELRARHPDLLVEVLSGNESLDLARREADLAVRLVKTVQPDLICKRITGCGWSLYAAESYVARAGVPKSATDLSGHEIVGFDETMSGVPGAKWLEAHGQGARFVIRGNSIVSVLNATLVGMGIGALPCFLGSAEPTLRRITSTVIGTRDVSLVYHPDMARVARVRAVMDFVVEVIQRDAALLAG